MHNELYAHTRNHVHINNDIASYILIGVMKAMGTEESSGIPFDVRN